jgi:hypothetical protein
VAALLEAGNIVETGVADEKLRGTGIGIARLAASRGFRVEFRPHDGRLAMRRSSSRPVKEKLAAPAPAATAGVKSSGRLRQPTTSRQPRRPSELDGTTH